MKSLKQYICEGNPFESPVGLLKTPNQFVKTPQVDLDPHCRWIFTVIKPGFLNLAPDIINIFKDNGWSVYKTIIKKLSLKEAHKLYYVHRKEDFYETLCKYMTSAPCMAIIYTKPGEITPGMFERTNAIKDEIRKKWSESDMRNVMHSSDKLSNMEKEASVFF